MENNRLTELINKQIDNEISPEEKILLDNELQANPSSRKLLDDMAELKSKLDTEFKNTEKIDFEEEIMGKIKNNEVNKSLFLDRLNNILLSISGSFSLSYVYILIFGVGLGILGMALMNSPKNTLNTDSMIGTMSDISTYSNFSRGGNLYIDKQNIDLTVNTQYSTRMILAQIDIKSPDEVKVIIGYNKQNLMITGLKVLKNNDVNNLMTGYSQVELNNKGEGKYLLFFEKRYDNPQDLSVKVYQNSQLVDESSIKTEN